MEQAIIKEMAAVGFTEKVGDIFLDWETVKDEILEPDKKAGTGNGTIHIFLGKEGYNLFQNLYPDYFNQVKSTNETSTNAPKVKHFFSKANLISSIGHVCNYYVQKNETGKVLDLVTKVVAKLKESTDKYFTTESLFKWSTGSSDLRPYFKQFDEGFQKTIRPLFLPNSAYKISLYRNKNNECAAFWLIGFAGLTDFEMDSTISNLRDEPNRCVCKDKKLTEFILKCTEYFRNTDDLGSIVPYAAEIPANNPIKVSKDGDFSLTGMFLETEISEIRKRNEQHSRWFENEFALGERKVFLSNQWNANGNYQLTLTDFVKLVQTCYGKNYYYKLGQNGEHELWIKRSSINTSLNDSQFPLQQIFYGAPGTGKSHEIDGQTNDDNSIRTTFHPDTDYATFVGAYKPMMETADEYALDATGKTHQVVYPNDKKSIVYKYEPQVFLKAYVEAWKRYLNKQEGGDNSYYLVIEEINRGNCAQIFGDLFQLLDREDNGYSSYAISPESAITKYLAEEAQSADGTKFSDLTFSNVIKKRGDVEKIIATAGDLKAGKRMVLPPNLHIWATMNTSDQSLFPIDSAFKRRWDWKYMPIKYDNNDWKIVLGNMKYPWTAFQKEINKRIYEATNSEDKQMGDWFVRAEANIISESLLLNKIVFYLWNDVCKDGEGDIFNIKISENETKAIKFSEFFEGNTTQKLQQWMNYLTVMPDTAKQGNDAGQADATTETENE